MNGTDVQAAPVHSPHHANATGQLQVDSRPFSRRCKRCDHLGLTISVSRSSHGFARAPRLAGGYALCVDGELTSRARALVAAIPYAPSRAHHVAGVVDQCVLLAQRETADDRDVLVAAALLHDVGYAARLRDTGQHSIDGARHLQRLGFDSRVVSLVAHHTGAAAEARERGLEAALAAFDDSPLALADILTAADLCVGPGGDAHTPDSRVAEILSRYPAGSVVHRAVAQASAEFCATYWRAHARADLTQPMYGSGSPAR